MHRSDTLWKCTPKYNQWMSTALIYCGTSEGFVIGADGRAFNKLTRQIQSDAERKIFAFQNRAASIVFAWAGVVKTRVLQSDFSLIEETYNLLPQLNFEGSFAEDLNAKLKNSLRILGANDCGKCATGIFLSFKKGVPWVSELSVFKNGRTWDCCVGEGEANGEIDILSGPSKEFKHPNSMRDAENEIKSYLDDCVSHPTEEIGGHVHIAKFTHEGFSWIQTPIQ